jgi:hypothetical protein
MKPFVLREVQRLPISLPEAWSFFSDPRNLPRITPPSLGLEQIFSFRRRFLAREFDPVVPG